ncbi:hypothetical protein [Streptacidiphilus rugosus]|uniref:hypothetical protein n=1 Tax=Streptacidiphilus rugosus TaxID=405783 RepID=UPI000566F847|nr:hypothetical protein [Streptacidiphilus rugosus]
MLVLLVILVLIAIAFGVLGAIVKGLFWLLIIGCVVFVGAVLYGFYRFGKRVGRGSKSSTE